MRKIAVVTGSRAEYGQMKAVIEGIIAAESLDLALVVTSTHLDEHYGYTISEIENDGYPVAAAVPLELGAGAPIEIVASVARGTERLGMALDDLKPDVVVVFADRFEMLAAAQAAMFLNLPIAHIAGGDTAHGTHDNHIRHSITKMSQAHFVTHSEARTRVIQLGEHPDAVFDVGALTVDSTLRSETLIRPELEANLRINLPERFVTVAYHPLSLDHEGTEREIASLLCALTELHAAGFGVILTGTNADAGNEIVRNAYTRFQDQCANGVWFFESLGSNLFHNVVRHSVALIGNSSSGLYEAPLLGTPTVNIGMRQFGRASGSSVLHASATPESIRKTLDIALSGGVSFDRFPYGSTPAAPRIINHLEGFDFEDRMDKSFFDVSFDTSGH